LAVLIEAGREGGVAGANSTEERDVEPLEPLREVQICELKPFDAVLLRPLAPNLIELEAARCAADSPVNSCERRRRGRWCW
jgi:hypothetical protein